MRRAEEFEEFEQLRPLLFSIAYRILGSVSEAEPAKSRKAAWRCGVVRSAIPGIYLNSAALRQSHERGKATAGARSAHERVPPPEGSLLRRRA